MKILAFLRKLVGRKEPVEKLEPTEPEESGVENCSQDELTLNDLIVKYEPDRLGDHLPVFGDTKEIIRIHRDHPEYLNARRIND